MEGTKPKSIFDIPKTIVAEGAVEIPKIKRKRRIKKTRRPKVAKAGGVSVSEVTNVKGQKEISLKHKGGLIQNITIYTGDQKPRGVKAKGQTASWNLKPAKFKASRGLRDDRVYIQPPKREYFGNRYKSALDKIRIDQKVREAGLLKNKEVEEKKERADREVREVRDRQQQERLQLEQRERAKDATIEELRRERAGIVASHNISVRNQSRATILGGDVGELNKLIRRRGYGAIEFLVRNGEITDQSTILQLDLGDAELRALSNILKEEKSDFSKGSKIVYLTGTGLAEEGVVVNESEKFVIVEKNGKQIRIPKSNIQSGQRVAEVRSQSRDPSVRRGRNIPTAEEFGSPRPAGSSAEERPAWRRDRKVAEERQQQRRQTTPFEEKLRKQSQRQPEVELTAEEQEEIRFKIYESMLRPQSHALTTQQRETFEEVLAQSPPAGVEEQSLRLELPSDESETALLEESYRQSRERELQRQIGRLLEEGSPEIQSFRPTTEPAISKPQPQPEPELSLEPEAQPTPREFFEGLQRGEILTLPRQRSAERAAQIEKQRRAREASRERTAQLIEQSEGLTESTTDFLARLRREEETEKRPLTSNVKIVNRLNENSKVITFQQLQTAIEKLSPFNRDRELRALDRIRTNKSRSPVYGFRNDELARALRL